MVAHVLELLRVESLQGSDYSLVAGTVRNAGGNDLLLLTVAVKTQGGAGNQATLGEAPIADSPLSPGEESTFVCVIRTRGLGPAVLLEFRDPYGRTVPAYDSQQN
jgi:hypothetical protein